MCCEHSNGIHKILDKSDADYIIQCIKDGDYHPAQLLNVIQLHVQLSNNSQPKIYLIGIMAHCGRKAGNYAKNWLLSLGNVSSPERLFIFTFHCDGCSEWRRSKQELLTLSTQDIDCKLNFVPKKVIKGEFITTSDQRHNIKGSYGQMFKHGVFIVNTKITTTIIKKYCIELQIHKIMNIAEHTVNNVLDNGHQNDPMNVKNALLFFRVCDNVATVLADKLKDESYTQKIRKYKLKEISALIIYSKVQSSYIRTLFNRDATWKTILFNFAVSAFGNYILFKEKGSKYSTWENYYEKQSTSKGLYYFCIS